MLGTGISQSTNPGGSINPGLIQFASNKQLDEREDDARKSLREAQEQQNQPAILNLASHLRTLWQSAKDGKMEIDQRLLKCLRQRNGEYEPELAAQIKAHGGSDICGVIGIKIISIRTPGLRERGNARNCRNLAIGQSLRHWQAPSFVEAGI